MVNTCAFCSSGKKGSEYTGPYFAFPSENTNPELREQWLNSLPVPPDYIPAKSARLCAHHFDPDDIEIERKDQRGNRAALGDLQVKHLKKDAVPKIWPDYPAYVSKTIPKRRSSTSLADARAEKEKIATLKRNQVSSIPELREKMKQIPSSVHEVLDDGGNLVYFSLVTSPIPHIRFSIVVSPDMAFSVAVNNVILPQKHFHELVPAQKILYSTDVVSLIECARNLSADEVPTESILQTARSLLESCINTDDEKATKIGFLVEQLDLLGKAPTARRYSPYTLAIFFTDFSQQGSY